MFNKICIYCRGEYGIRTYLELKRYGIRVDMFGDKDPERQGYVLDDIYCKSYEKVLQEEKDIMLIVAITNPNKLIQHFKELGFVNVYDKDAAVEKLTVGKTPIEYTLIRDIEVLKKKQQEIVRGLYYKDISSTDEEVLDIVEEYHKRKAYESSRD